MLDPPAQWLRRPAILTRVVWTWVKPKSWKQNLYAPKLGPDRAEMLAALELKAA